MGGRKTLIYDRVLEEENQGHSTRRGLLTTLSNQLSRPVVTFFTSFRYPVMIQDDDADMLEGVLRSLDLSDGLALCISSPGGDGLAAERIVNMCREYSGTDEYWAIVPGKAKSAGTMICFGASKVLMGPTSELGPVDPQLQEGRQVFSVFNIIQSYRELFDKAVKEEGNLEPYLQQLQHYDEREIAEMQSQLDLSQDIAARVLASGMMEGKKERTILKEVKMFLTPEQTKTHGRPIYREEAANCGLNVEAADPESETWGSIYDLYIRTNNLVQRSAAKCIESSTHSYSVGAPVER